MSTRPPILTVVGLMLCLLQVHCKETPSIDSTANSLGTSTNRLLREGSRPFSFDEKAVTEFWISKNDPADGDHWTARLHTGLPEKWELDSGPNDAPLVDRLADSGFIQHLLSTLQTLEITESGLAVTRDAAGLITPKYTLRWTSPNGLHELVLGQTNTPSGASYALLPKLSTANPVVGVRGALLGMLEHLKTFDILRHRHIWTWAIDDVYSVEVYQGTRKTFSAQRMSGDWSDDQNRLYLGPAQEWLERLMHLMILKFNDDSADAQRLYKKIEATPSYRITIKDRTSRARSLSVGLEDGTWWGLEDGRPGAVFRLAPEVATYLLPPRVKLSARKKAASPKKH